MDIGFEGVLELVVLGLDDAVFHILCVDSGASFQGNCLTGANLTGIFASVEGGLARMGLVVGLRVVIELFLKWLEGVRSVSILGCVLMRVVGTEETQGAFYIHRAGLGWSESRLRWMLDLWTN